MINDQYYIETTVFFGVTYLHDGDGDGDGGVWCDYAKYTNFLEF